MFERCLYFNINSLARAVNKIWDDAFSEFGLAPSHAYLLRLVLSNPGLTQRDISTELKLEKSTITRFLDVLQQQALIQRKKGMTGDGREQGIFPTAKSKKLQVALEAKGNELYLTMKSKIGDKKLDSLVKELRNIKKII